MKALKENLLLQFSALCLIIMLIISGLLGTLISNEMQHQTHLVNQIRLEMASLNNSSSDSSEHNEMSNMSTDQESHSSHSSEHTVDHNSTNSAADSVVTNSHEHNSTHGTAMASSQKQNSQAHSGHSHSTHNHNAHNHGNASNSSTTSNEHSQDNFQGDSQDIHAHSPPYKSSIAILNIFNHVYCQQLGLAFLSFTFLSYQSYGKVGVQLAINNFVSKV